MDITFTINDAKLQKVVDALNGLYPRQETDNQSLTPEQWAKEVIRRWVVMQTARFDQMQKQKAVAFAPDDTIIQ